MKLLIVTGFILALLFTSYFLWLISDEDTQ
jgi:hypothetical protein